MRHANDGTDKMHISSSNNEYLQAIQLCIKSSQYYIDWSRSLLWLLSTCVILTLLMDLIDKAFANQFIYLRFFPALCGSNHRRKTWSFILIQLCGYLSPLTRNGALLIVLTINLELFSDLFSWRKYFCFVFADWFPIFKAFRKFKYMNETPV